MYQEWMEGVPILVPGCYEHNIEQLKKLNTIILNTMISK